MNNEKKNDNKSQEEIKRRKSAKITNFSEMKMFPKNLDNSSQSEAQLAMSPPLKFKSNSLFAYQEIDKFSSFCDNESFPLDILSYLNDNQNQNQNKNNNTNNRSTKQEECEELESSSDESIYNEMSDDEIIFRKYKHRMEKRKSALNSVPHSFKHLSSIKTNEIINNNTNLGSGQKINQNTVMPNNYINNNNFILNNNNNLNNDNFRRSSYSTNPIQNNLFFNNILNNNQQNSFNQYIFPQKIIDNNLNNSSSMSNNSSNYNNNSNNYIQNNNNKLTNSPNQINLAQRFQNNNNFSNYNYMNNFAYNFYNNNNIQDSISKKRNSMFLLPTTETQVQRRSSHTSIPSISTIQMMNSDKKLKIVNNEKEESPNYFLKDQLYCRQIQNKLDKNINNLKYSDEFYENIKSQLVEIIEHQFGNYVMQKFLTVLLFQENKKLFKMIFLDINNKLFEICIHNYGTRVIQKTLEKLDNGNYYKIETNELNDVIKNLIENHLYELCCDKNGNHVYQKLLRIFPKERNQFLYDSLIKISFPVSIIQQGATLLQTAFDFSSKEQQEKLCTVIIDKIEDLINDKYGNYTIQTIFKLYNDKINDRIYEYINENILQLSKEKFSSNVIDKCILENSEKSHKLIDNMIKKNIIKDMIVDKFGNYVVQKAMSISDRNTCEKIAEQIKPKLGELQKTNIGKKVYEKLMQKKLF